MTDIVWGADQQRRMLALIQEHLALRVEGKWIVATMYGEEVARELADPDDILKMEDAEFIEYVGGIEEADKLSERGRRAIERGLANLGRLARGEAPEGGAENE